MKTYAASTLTALLLLAACSEAPASAADLRETSETRPVGAFDQVKAARGLEVTIICGGTPQAKIEGAAVDVADVELRLQGHTLTIGRASTFGGHSRPIHIELTAPKPLDRLEASSGATLKVPACAVSTERLDVESSSGGTLRLAGTTGRLVAEASSGGDIEPLPGEHFDAGSADLNASSGGSIKVCKVSNMSGHASSGGDITTEPGGVANEIHSSSGGSIGTRRCS
jgi:hypothetical protein